MLGHFIFCPEALEFGEEIALNRLVIAVAVHALKFVGVFLEIEQLPFIVLIKVNELVTAVGDPVMAGNAVGAGEFVVVIIEMGAPMLGNMTLE